MRQSKPHKPVYLEDWSALYLVVEWILEAAPGLCAPVAAMDSVGAPGQVEFFG